MPPGLLILDDLIRRARRRAAWQFVVARSLWAVTAALAAAALLLMLGTGVVAWYVPPVVFVLASGVALWTLRGRLPHEYGTAQALDNALHTSDLLSSAWYASTKGARSYFAPLLFEQAETAARVALAFKPGWDEASISLVRALALQNSESCVGLLTKSIQQSPKSWRLLLLSAMLHQGQRDYYAAVKDADKVIALAPNTARAYAVRAACRGREEYDVAVKDWARAQQLAPGSAELYIGSAGFYLWHEKPKEALKDLQLAIRCDPINSKNYLLKGLVLMDLARPAEAVTALRNAVSLAPADWQCRTSLGTALYTAADYAGAIEQMSLALRLRPRTGQLDLQPGTIDAPPALFRVPHPPLEELIDRPENPNQITIVELPLFDPTIWVIRGASQYKLAKPAEALPDLKRYIALADMFHEYCEKVMHAPPIAEVKRMAAEASR